MQDSRIALLSFPLSRRPICEVLLQQIWRFCRVCQLVCQFHPGSQALQQQQPQPASASPLPALFSSIQPQGLTGRLFGNCNIQFHCSSGAFLGGAAAAAPTAPCSARSDHPLMQVGRAEVLLQKGSWQQQEQGVSRPSRPASPQQGNASKQSEKKSNNLQCKGPD